MNTVGKILVILNFLFAVTVGLLLVLDIALRNQWKDAYLTLKREAEVMSVERKATEKVINKVTDDNKRLTAADDTLKQKLKKTEDDASNMEDVYKAQKADLENQLTVANTTSNDQLGKIKRSAFEIGDLNATVKERESTIVKLQADIKRYRTEAVQFEQVARARQLQNENLLDQLREATRQVALRDAGANVEAIRVRNPNEPNPPAVKVDGKIEKVDGGDLVQISLGTDHGVNKDNTLDVYRMTPDPKYLGMVRIVDANTHKSVARLIVTGNANFRTPLREGDLVTSKIK